MVPTSADLHRWIDQASARGARAIRTGALFPDAVAPFVDAGFVAIEELALLRRELGPGRRMLPRINVGPHTRHLSPTRLGVAAAIDRACFGDTWANDIAGLTEVIVATPAHRARAVQRGGEMLAFAISGRAGRHGYLQRLAVAPHARRRGIASALVTDALAWMRRHGVRDVLVNTATDNDAALGLYRRLGFVAVDQRLTILERDLR